MPPPGPSWTTMVSQNPPPPKKKQPKTLMEPNSLGPAIEPIHTDILEVMSKEQPDLLKAYLSGNPIVNDLIAQAVSKAKALALPPPNPPLPPPMEVSPTTPTAPGPPGATPPPRGNSIPPAPESSALASAMPSASPAAPSPQGKPAPLQIPPAKCPAYSTIVGNALFTIPTFSQAGITVISYWPAAHLQIKGLPTWDPTTNCPVELTLVYQTLDSLSIFEGVKLIKNGPAPTDTLSWAQDPKTFNAESHPCMVTVCFYNNGRRETGALLKNAFYLLSCCRHFDKWPPKTLPPKKG
ncbi:hypothetical protein H0H81_000754 [Sphagnurus paluster]|uniref:Uncharacterized protein n=1 Tax=Sphagnurus paluster TaxID=117069 RepID=A0A9P7K1V9_9AGAR|nr:hypothetical protein H0H81_000754 [Sphagnurus paluster]